MPGDFGSVGCWKATFNSPHQQLDNGSGSDRQLARKYRPNRASHQELLGIDHFGGKIQEPLLSVMFIEAGCPAAI